MCIGTPSPPSFVPFAFFGFSDNMSYSERIQNFLGLTLNWFARTFLYHPKMEKVYRDLIDPNLPSIKEIEANASIILSNSHVSFTKPRPLMPDIVEVGGLHLKSSKPVPKVFS
jgi:glucuronosyltransferase